ncbi:MAG: ABC transporter permease, partial [Thermomicrobiales bacterium]
ARSRRRPAPATLLARNPAAAAGGVILLAMFLIAICAPVLFTTDPMALAPTERLQPPSAAHWFGTDMLGRDLYSRVIYGARVTLLVGFSITAVALLIGTLVGVLAGYLRRVDLVIMRVMDGIMAIPPILLAVALMALTRASVQNVIIAIAVAEIPRVARLVRGVVLSLREMLFVEAAIASGTRTPAIIFRHILPNAVAPITVQAAVICASAMLIEAALSFIGAGVPPSVPSWGNIIAEGRTIWQIAPYLVFIPATFLALTVLALNLVGDGLRDVLDPRFRTNL